MMGFLISNDIKLCIPELRRTDHVTTWLECLKSYNSQIMIMSKKVHSHNIQFVKMVSS